MPLRFDVDYRDPTLAWEPTGEWWTPTAMARLGLNGNTSKFPSAWSVWICFS